jgi:uncharacterized beta-barrel protein YwiB (DUF1934 family)
LQESLKRKTVYKKVTQGINHQSRENKSISARAMGRSEKLYFKTEGDYIQKNQAVYQLYSEDLAIAKHDYFTAFKR